MVENKTRRDEKSCGREVFKIQLSFLLISRECRRKKKASGRCSVDGNYFKMLVMPFIGNAMVESSPQCEMEKVSEKLEK